jgi:DNA-binding response OmpR family regulator
MKSILVVEDETDMQEIYRDIFREEGKAYSVDIVGDCAAASAKLSDRAYDLLICDVIMEPMMGDMLYLSLKDHDKNRLTPVLFITVLREEYLSHIKGPDARISFLQKPVTKESLFSKISAILA